MKELKDVNNIYVHKSIDIEIQKELIDCFIKQDLDYEQIKNKVNNLTRQVGKKAILESNYLYLCIRKRKIKQICNQLLIRRAHSFLIGVNPFLSMCFVIICMK